MKDSGVINIKINHTKQKTTIDWKCENAHGGNMQERSNRVDFNEPTTSFNNCAVISEDRQLDETNSSNSSDSKQQFPSMNDINEPQLSSTPISTIEHRKRHRRRMGDKTVWRGELVERRKKVSSHKGINDSLQNCKKIKKDENVKIFSLTTSILVLAFIIFFAQFVIGITAINSNSNTANNPNFLMQNYPTVQNENVSAEQFTENIWKIELPNEIGPIKEWQAFLKVR